MKMLSRDTLAEQLAERAEITMAAARDEVNWFFDTIAGAILAGDEVRIHGFGGWKTSQRAARVAHNPRTMEQIKVPARRVVRFAPSTTLAAALKGKGASARVKTTAKASKSTKAKATVKKKTAK